MVLDELGIYLDAQGVVERDGASRDLYEGVLPDETPDPAVALYLSGAWQGPEVVLGGEGLTFEFPTIEVMARGLTLSTTYALIRNVYLALVKIGSIAGTGQGQTLNGTTTTNVRYLACEPAQQPYILDRDTNLRWRLVCNFRLTKGPS